MKRFIFGTLFGALLISATAFADDVKSMIGKTVDGTFPVHVNGKLLSTEAIVIEGTSYAPVRVIAETVGLNVKFDQKEGILLDKPIVTQEETAPEVNKEGQLRRVDGDISRLFSEIFGLKEVLGNRPDDQLAESWRQLLAEDEAKLKQLQKEKEELEKK